MYDSITATDIPLTAEMVAGYLPPSKFAWSDDDWSLFPKAVKVRIAVRGDVTDGHVLDVEQGDATSVQAVSWVLMRRHMGADPTVYCNIRTFPSVVAAFNAAHVALPHFWVAHYDGQAVLTDGYIAKQYTDSPANGGHYDLSVVADYWPGVDSPPTPPAPPRPDMEMTDVIPATPKPGTVAFVLRDLQRGYTGVNAPGGMALDIINTTADVDTLITAVGQLAQRLTAIETTLTAISTALKAGE